MHPSSTTTATLQPKIIVIRRRQNQGFGFTLRHFIAYPPEDEESWPKTSDTYQRKPMETIFIKEVQPNGPAYFAGLQTGDRVLMVNNIPIAGVSYSAIVTMIKKTQSVLQLHVVPKECDILQMRYDIAHTPESNRLSKASTALVPSASGQSSMQQKMISSYPIDSVRQHQQHRTSTESAYSDLASLRKETNSLLRSKPPNLTVLTKPHAADAEFMIRLRKSIEQKEEFLKSPVPHSQSAFFHQQPQMLTRSSGNSLLKPTSRDLLPASCDMNSFYAKNLPAGFTDSVLNHSPIDGMSRRGQLSQFSSNGSSPMGGRGSPSIKEKFHKELEFLESLPELGVTNQVFERKLVSHLAKGFDPFKPLSINTAGDLVKKHNNFDTNFIDAQAQTKAQGRMEVHKANLAATTVEDYKAEKSSLKVADTIQEGKTSRSGEKVKNLQTTSEVVRRYKSVVVDDNKPMRRISYLRATNNENDYNLEIVSDFPAIQENNKRTSIQNDTRQSVQIDELPEINGKSETKDMATEVEMLETEMEIKSSCIYGKRISEYRSWRQVKIELKGDILKIYPGRSSKSENNVIELDVRNFNILDETVDKKKHVFRLQSKPRSVASAATSSSELLADGSASGESSGNNDKFLNNNEYTEILFKTKSVTEMRKLFGLLQDKCGIRNGNEDYHGKQLAEPQKTAATTTSYCDENNVQDCSPQSSTSRGEPDTDSISPVMKPRKSQQKYAAPDKDLGSPKTKNWKDLLFRRNHGNNADISPSNLASNAKTTGTIGVPLKLCPMSKDNEFVPRIVDVCTTIVETKGLNVIGIYRIPGNKAAISELKEQVNKSDFTWDKCNTDVRWEDVNVVSSLLKLFIRSLPDALLPSTFYINFIEADKKTGERRLKELKYLLKSLPPYCYETLKHIIRHLHRVSKNCEVNFMEPKNLAIIFGPSIIRSPNETLEIAVKDMKHQCMIVESLVVQYEYFFEDAELPEMDFSAVAPTSITTTSAQDQTSLLLHNVSKIEQRLNDRESLTSRLIPHLRRRTHSKRSAVSSDTYSGDSVLSLDYKKSPEAPLKENIAKPCKERNSSVEITVLLTDDESSNSRISDSGSMSLTTITDTLDTKLRNLRSGSESNDENDGPLNNQTTNNQTTTSGTNKQNSNRRGNSHQPLVLHENIPYADESPERPLISDGGLPPPASIVHLKNFPNFPSRNFNFIRDISRNPRFSSVYESCSDDSEVSTTSDPKESLIISPLFQERYKKRRDYRLFRSASFNCRNYSSRGGGGGGTGGGSCNNSSALTKDEKTDMNLTKKRQIQNKQNRSIKRRHTVGGPHDYPTTVIRRAPANNDHVLEVGIRIKNVNRRN